VGSGRKSFVATGLVGACLLAACGSPSGAVGRNHTILFGLNVPSSTDPYVAGVITRGAKLAVDQENAAGGVAIGGSRYQLALKTYDDHSDPQQAADNVETAIHDGAVAVIEDGIGASISAPKSAAAGVPEIIVADGNAGLLTTPSGPLPSLFGARIPNSAASDVLATYISKTCQHVAILHDDTDNGKDGAMGLTSSLENTDITPSPVIEVPTAAPNIDAEVQEVAVAKPCGIALWGSDLFIAKALSAIRTAGITTQIYTSQQGESPTVRLLDGNAETDGMKIVTGRMTSESDSTSFPSFERALAKYALGPTNAGFKDAEGQEIRQPNDVDFFSYDSVHIVLAALKKQGSVTTGPTLLTDMTLVTVVSANGDARGFDSQAHEFFAFEDAYIAVIHDMQFEPVKDEALSATLPDENEILADFDGALESCNGAPCPSS